MKLDLKETSVYCSPHAFIDRRGEPTLIKVMEDGREPDLLEMYLHYEPKNSFNGLPPEQEGACVMWVKSMLETGINLAALSFDHGIVGHAAIFPMSDTRCEFFVFVSQNHQSIGIGTELTRNAIHIAYELGFQDIWLCVEQTNKKAMHVYSKCGFQYLPQADPDDIEMSFDISTYHQSMDQSIGELVNRDAIFISPDMLCRDAANIGLDNHICSLPVVDSHKNVMGILSATDLIVSINPTQRVRDIITRGVVTVHETSPVSKVIRLLNSRHLRCIPVLSDKEEFVGIIGRREILFHYQKTVWATDGGKEA